jgi:hypothetical protein
MPSNDLNFPTLDSPQSGIMPKPVTLASAATVNPVTMLSFITGTVAIATITPPADGFHELVFVFTTTTPVAFTTTGNIKTVATPTTNVPVILYFNPIEQKYYVGVLKAT